MTADYIGARNAFIKLEALESDLNELENKILSYIKPLNDEQIVKFHQILRYKNLIMKNRSKRPK